MFIESLETRQLFSNLPTGFTQHVIGTQLGEPTAIDVLPDGRALITIKSGAVDVVYHNAVQKRPVVSLTVDSDGERGMIGVTHDPDFATNHYIYLYHTVPATSTAAAYNEITRYTMSGNSFVHGSGLNILALNKLSTATNHNGGAMKFGSDGMLYVGVGENGKQRNSQTLGNLLGKVLRIDVSDSVAGDPINDVAKLVPSDNPFVSQTSGINGAIYALGFRNPFSLSEPAADGNILVNDVGSRTWEEVDRLLPGRNYGWPFEEGFAGTVSTKLGAGTYADPLLAYNHHGGVAGGGNAIIGGIYYAPPSSATRAFPASDDGRYFYADYGFDYLRSFDPTKPGTLSNPDTSTLFESKALGHTTGMALSIDGSIYVVDEGGGGELSAISYRA